MSLELLETSKPDFSVTEITPDIHLCPGIGTLEYIYNRDAKELVVNHSGEEFMVLHGYAAKSVYYKVIGMTENIDPDEVKVNQMAIDAFGHSLLTLSDPTRKTDIKEERQICMWYFKNYTNKSDSATGEIFGGFARETVIHASNHVNELMCSDMDFKRKVEKFLKTVE